MNADDLQQLYKLLRGSRAASAVLDAHALFLDQRFSQAHEVLSQAHQTYAEARSRLLRQHPDGEPSGSRDDVDRQTRRLKRKQDKAREILELFEELEPKLLKLAERDRIQRQASAPPAERPNQSEHDTVVQAAEDTVRDTVREQAETVEEEAEDYVLARQEIITDDFAVAFRTLRGDEQLDLISSLFGFREVESVSHIHPDALYFIRSGAKSFLIRTLPQGVGNGEVRFEGALDGQQMKPFSESEFLRLGAKRKMVLLIEKHRDADEHPQGDFDPTATIEQSLGADGDD